MKTKTRMFEKVFLAAVMMFFITACGGSSTSPEDESCGQGDEIKVADQTFCVYSQGITEEGFDCPPHVDMPAAYGNMLICSADGQHPDGLFDHLHDRYDADELPTGQCMGVTCETNQACMEGTCEARQCFSDSACPGEESCGLGICQDENPPSELEACLDECFDTCPDPQLQTCAGDGERYCSTCEMECRGLEPAEDTLICGLQYWEVAHYLVPCVGEGSFLCMWVRRDSEDSFGALYSPIEGFTHQWGRNYTISLNIEEIPDPPADGSSQSYTLVEIIDESPVAAGTLVNVSFSAAVDANLLISVDGTTGTIGDDRAFRCAPESVCSEIEAYLTNEEPFEINFRYDSDIDAPLIVESAEDWAP